MKCSIIYNVLESYEIVRRQILHMSRIVPKDWEVIIVDDGSDPPIIIKMAAPFDLKVLYTLDGRFWTQGAARNLGASRARGEYLFMSDIDHMLSEEAVWAITEFTGTKMVFKRTKAILNGEGKICQDKETLREYGCPEPYLKGEQGAGWNIFAMRRDLFFEIGGYLEVSGYGIEDVDFSKRTGQTMTKLGLARHTVGPAIYLYPNPRRDAKGVFHSLRRRWTRYKVSQGPRPF